MRGIIGSVITAILLIVGIVIGWMSGFVYNPLMVETMKILLIIMGCSMAYCFIVGEISRNNSQMDKLWSVLPIIYVWVIAAKGGFQVRLIVMAVIVTIWGARLTYNFAKKGAYSIKFWAGEEDYRWAILRKNKIMANPIVWAIFDLFFISIYQNALVLLTCLPMVLCMSSEEPFGVMDIIVAIMMLACVAYEAIADVQQMKFQTTKWDMIKEGKKLEELPAPYNKGFNTQGLWGVSRHPNYLGEQSTWVCFYLFCVAAKTTTYGIFNSSIIGCLLLIFLFMGSSTLAEIISSKKYPEYKAYQKRVFKYLPFRKYNS